MPLKKVKLTVKPELQPVKVQVTNPIDADFQILDREFATQTKGQPDVDQDVQFLDSNQPLDTDFGALRRADFPAIDKVLTTGEDAARFTKSILGGAIGWGLDQLSRGQYGAAKFLDSHAGSAQKTFLDALRDGFNEAISPKEKLSTADVIRKNNPAFAKESPIATEVVGLLGDILFDPITYVTGGAKGLMINVAGKEKHLSKKGEKIFKVMMTDANEAARLGQETFGTPVNNLAIRESLDKQMMRLIETNPALEDKGVYRFAGSAFGTTGLQNKIREAASAIGDKLADTSVGQAIIEGRKLFDRNYQLNPEYVHTRTKLEGHKDAWKNQVEKTALKIFENIDEAGRERIVQAGYKSDQQTKLLAKDKARELGVEHIDLTPQELADIRNTNIRAFNLRPDEIAAYSRLLQDFEEAKQLETAAGLLVGSRQNYFPRMYKMIQDPEQFRFVRNVLRDPTLKTKLNANEKRVYDLMEEAVADGLTPEMDALVLYTNRMLESKKALANAEFKDDVLRMFDVNELGQLPRAIQDDIRFIGDSIYPRFIKEEAHKWVNRFDRLQAQFKKAATVYKPNFGVRQAVANPLQSYAVQGLKAFKMLDPRVMTDVGALMAVRDGHLPPSALQEMRFSSPLGTSYTGEEVMKIFDDYNVLRGTQMGDERFVRNIKQELDRQQALSKVVGKDAANGMVLAGKDLNWTHWPAMVEDFSRASMVVNGLRIGHSPASAANLADKALFNYSEGLSALEKQFMRRVIPFYSYQRFAIPLFLRVAGTNPGRLATTSKAFQTAAQGASNLIGSFAKVSNGETLTESERRLTPNYIMEQPHTFQRFDEQMQAVYNTFNNFSLIDVLGTVETDDNGNLDVRRTVEKSLLSQITPFLKVPLEMILGKGLFSDRAIAEMDRLGNVGDIGRYLPEQVKDAISWEPGKTGPDGKPTVYVNPYLLNIARSVYPVLGELIKDLNPELTPLEKTMSTLFGIGTNKVDLNASYDIKLGRRVKKIQEKQKELSRFARQGRQKSFDKAERDLNSLVEDLAREQEQLEASPVRAATPPPALPDFLTEADLTPQESNPAPEQ